MSGSSTKKKLFFLVRPGVEEAIGTRVIVSAYAEESITEFSSMVGLKGLFLFLKA
jgi:hypothetical protein